MSNLICSKSGITFQCEHMPLNHNVAHPLFSAPQKKLISLAGQWSAQRLSATESYLLYLALLDSTDLLIWRSQCRYTAATAAVIANNMEPLIQIVAKINLIKHPSFVLPSFAISHDTATLENSQFWIQAWTTNYIEWHDDYLASQKRESKKHELESREESLTRLIRSSHSDPSKIANILASWAATAGSFPTSPTIHPLTQRSIPLADYWRELIRACVNEDKIFNYPTKDIQELIEHCEDTIENGHIHSHKLYEMLRGGISKKQNYLDFGDVDLAGATTSFRILDPESSAQDANMAAMILNAPASEPKRGAYPTVFAYLKAKTKWDLAQQQNRN